MSKTIWAASGGSYSDYRVYALFEKKEDAESYVDAGQAIWEVPSSSHGEIAAMPEYVEEFRLYNAVPEIHPWWKAQFSPVKGEVVAEEYPIQGPPAPKKPLVFMQKESQFGPMAKAGFREAPVAWCADREAAIKSVKDRMAALRSDIVRSRG